MIDPQDKPRSPRLANLSAHFLERAKHYRFVAAMTEAPREMERFCEVALMFKEMARDTQRSELYSRLGAGTWPRRECPSTTECKPGFVEAWVYKFVRIGRFIRLQAPISRVQGPNAPNTERL
ncbi:MAG TPA: hypothetical protein VNS63_04010 [Blastocatellia bacterium]|nr:hypothetical protein [Blastocatellia bacterium]